MAKSVLKPHATLFAAILRASDPAVTVVVGLIAHVAYLGPLPPPEHYQIFLAGGALIVAAIFPLFRLYEPQRGVSIVEEFRQLLFAWFLVAAIVGGGIFATKSGDAFSRVWVTGWLAGGLVLTATLRITVRFRAASSAPAWAQFKAHRDRRGGYAGTHYRRSAAGGELGRVQYRRFLR
jgi:hypothetical protein